MAKARENGLVSPVHIVCLVCLVFWLNETNQMNQINQINKTNQIDHQHKLQGSCPDLCLFSEPAKFMLSATLVSVPTLDD
jgi:hypothetical protein